MKLVETEKAQQMHWDPRKRWKEKARNKNLGTDDRRSEIHGRLVQKSNEKKIDKNMLTDERTQRELSKKNRREKERGNTCEISRPWWSQRGWQYLAGIDRALKKRRTRQGTKAETKHVQKRGREIQKFENKMTHGKVGKVGSKHYGYYGCIVFWQPPPIATIKLENLRLQDKQRNNHKKLFENWLHNNNSQTTNKYEEKTTRWQQL